MENQNMFILSALNCLLDSVQDFTDSMYVNKEQRERVLKQQSEVREQTLASLKPEETTIVPDTSENLTGQKPDQFKAAPILTSCEALKKLLHGSTMQLSNSLFRENEDATLLNLIKTYSASNHYDLLIETLDKFKEYSDHVLEVCFFNYFLCVPNSKSYSYFSLQAVQTIAPHKHN